MNIFSLYVGSPLSYLEILAIKSFLAFGHEFTLFTDRIHDNLPQGAVQKLAVDHFASPFDLASGYQLINGIHSDIFRLTMLARGFGMWVDMDVCAYRAFDMDGEHVFAHVLRRKQRDFPLIANAFLRLPSDSSALKLCLDMLVEPNPIPEFLRPDEKKKFSKMRDENIAFGFHDLPWTSTGPRLLTYALKKTGEMRHAMPIDAFFAGTPNMRHSRGPGIIRRNLTPGYDRADVRPAAAYAVHFYGMMRKILVESHDGLPPAESLLDHLCREYEVTPAADPIR